MGTCNGMELNGAIFASGRARQSCLDECSVVPEMGYGLQRTSRGGSLGENLSEPPLPSQLRSPRLRDERFPGADASDL